MRAFYGLALHWAGCWTYDGDSLKNEMCSMDFIIYSTIQTLEKCK